MAITIFQNMIGKTIKSIDGKIGDGTMVFTSTDDKTFTFYHNGDCCEVVDINDIIGDIDDLIDSPILVAEEVDQNSLKSLYAFDNGNELGRRDENDESYVWTFYRFATVKGNVTVRWYGTSNGYYSMDVSYTDDCDNIDETD